MWERTKKNRAQPPDLAACPALLLNPRRLDSFHPPLSFLWHPALVYILQAYFTQSNQSDEPSEGFTIVLVKCHKGWGIHRRGGALVRQSARGHAHLI